MKILFVADGDSTPKLEEVETSHLKLPLKQTRGEVLRLMEDIEALDDDEVFVSQNSCEDKRSQGT